MSSSITCLFLGGGKRYWMAEHFHKTARKLGLRFHLVTYDLIPQVHIAGLAKVITGKKFTEWDEEDLNSAIEKSGANLVIPFMDAALPVLSKYTKTGVNRIVCDPKTVETFNDKALTRTWALENHIPIPPATGYPYYVKPRFGFGSRDNYIVRSMRDWFPHFSYDKYYVEHYLEGATEYSVDCYVTLDKKYYAFPRQRLLVSRGEVENSVTISNDVLRDLAVQVLVLGNIQGPANIQFLSHEGKYYLIDVNLRFGGGSPLTIHAGADYGEMLLREHVGLPTQPINWRPNVLMIRAAREIFFEDYTDSA